MFLSAKSKGFVFDKGEQISTLARVSSFKPPIVVEDLREFQTSDSAALGGAIAAISANKKTGSYFFAKCGISPDQGFVRRATIDPKRLKEENYLSELANSQFRIDPALNAVAVLNAVDGLELDAVGAAPAKDVILCGMPNSVLKEHQAQLLQDGVFPESIELSSLVSLAALVDYMKFSGSTKPVLVLELGAQGTQSYIVSSKGVDAVRPITVGLEAMVPVVQKELGLKDEESARKLFFSNTFDFTGMGAALCKRLLKELQSSMGFYEVQTGQSISQLVCSVLPNKLSWLEGVIAGQLGVSVLTPDLKPWLSSRGISISESVNISDLNVRKFSTLGLIIEFVSKSTDVSET